MKKETQIKYMNGKDRVNQILDEACRLFAKKSYDSISVREIADACECSPALIMKNFKSKEDIYKALFDEWVEMCSEPLIQQLPEGPPDVVLEQIYELLISGGDQYTHAYRTNLTSAVESRISYQAEISQMKENAQDISSDIILPLILQAQGEGIFKQGDAQKMSDIVWFVIYGSRLLSGSFSTFHSVPFNIVKERILA